MCGLYDLRRGSLIKCIYPVLSIFIPKHVIGAVNSRQYSLMGFFFQRAGNVRYNDTVI